MAATLRIELRPTGSEPVVLTFKLCRNVYSSIIYARYFMYSIRASFVFSISSFITFCKQLFKILLNIGPGVYPSLIKSSPLIARFFKEKQSCSFLIVSKISK